MKRDREQLILGNLALVRQLARGFSSLDHDDLVSEGTLGLIDAADRFDSSLKIEFSTYAWPFIQGAMIDAINRELKRRAPGSIDPESVPSPHRSELTAVDVVWDAVEALPADQADAVVAMYGLDGRRPQGRADAAAELGTSEKRIRTACRRAIRSLRRTIRAAL